MKRSSIIGRWSCIIILLFAVLVAPLAVYADAIALPENDFYLEHQDELVYSGRSFAANGEDGSVAAREAPGAKGELTRLQNGEEIYIEATCLYDHEYWGFTYFCSGWVKMDEMLVSYDYVAFEEEHIGEFYDYKGSYEELAAAGEALVWPWPGAGYTLWTVEGLDTENFWVMHAWKDGDGREWGFVSYLFGSRNIWICLSDPMDGSIPAFNPGQAQTAWAPDTVHVNIEPGANRSVLLIIILVAVVAVVTLILIRTLGKRARRS